MERRLVIKDSDGLYTIYFTILSKVLARGVVLNFYIYKELFGLINPTLKIFYAFVLNQKALEVGCSDLIISDVSYSKYSTSFSNYFEINLYKDLYNCLIVDVNCTLCRIPYHGHYIFG